MHMHHAEKAPNCWGRARMQTELSFEIKTNIQSLYDLVFAQATQNHSRLEVGQLD
jgi:hypothetical protein